MYYQQGTFRGWERGIRVAYGQGQRGRYAPRERERNTPSAGNNFNRQERYFYSVNSRKYLDLT